MRKTTIQKSYLSQFLGTCNILNYYNLIILQLQILQNQTNKKTFIKYSASDYFGDIYPRYRDKMEFFVIK